MVEAHATMLNWMGGGGGGGGLSHLKRFPRFALYPIAHSYFCVGIIDPSILRAISNYLSKCFLH